MDKREELVKMLKEGDEFNIYKGDVDTFKWMLNYGLPSLGLKLGGGNLSVALIAVTTLSLLAKCYVILNGSQQYNSCSKMLNEQKGKKLTDRDINETDAFIQLVKDLDCLWGYKQEQVEEFWRRVRHKLVHSAYPKATIYPPYFTERTNKPFSINEGHYNVYPDHLWSKYLELKDVIINKITEGKFDIKLIEATIQFINDEKLDSNEEGNNTR